MGKLYIALTALLSAPALAQHSVNLTWLDGINPAGTTYGVYRAAAACSRSGTYLSIGASLSLAYADTSVAAGTTYCYYVTAVFGGMESAPSNTAEALVPADPPPPPPPPPPSGDAVPPSIGISIPPSLPRPSYALTAVASDNVGVVRVVWAWDGTPVGTALSAPWAYVLDTGKIKGNGKHTVTATAYDAAGNQATVSAQTRVQ